MQLFQKVHCKAYMQKYSDGVHISIYSKYFGPAETSFGSLTAHKELSSAKTIKGGETVLAEDSNGNVLKDLSACEGDSVHKQYYRRVEHDFDGFLVGIKRINAEGEIGTDWEDDPYYGEYGYCFKNYTWQPEVGVVYFRNNCKRYVLLDDIMEL